MQTGRRRLLRPRRAGHSCLSALDRPAGVPGHVSDSTERFRYASRVFIAPPWPEIFAQDAERKQTLIEADVYTELGYELVPPPLAPVATRLRFILVNTWPGA